MLPSFSKSAVTKKPSSGRNIAAPQTNNEPHSPTVHSDGVTQPLRSVSNDHMDHRNFSFDPLEDFDVMAFKTYCGPTPESNWVIPGKLLVGAYPASRDDDETFYLLSSILKFGINKFVCLQQEYRGHGVTEHMWRSGQALRPYFEDVKFIMRDPERFEIQAEPGYNLANGDDISFVHFPIKDCGVTDDDRVIELARNLVHSIACGDKIYLHCWGGHGRTGTLVSIMLHLMYNLSAKDAMARCQRVHDMREYPVEVGSPQTQAQRDQVTRVVKKLSSTRQATTFGNFLQSFLSPAHSKSAPALIKPDESMVSIIEQKQNNEGKIDSFENPEIPHQVSSIDTADIFESQYGHRVDSSSDDSVGQNESIEIINDFADSLDDLLDYGPENSSNTSSESENTVLNSAVDDLVEENKSTQKSVEPPKEILPPLKVEVLPAVKQEMKKNFNRAVTPTRAAAATRQRTANNSNAKFTATGYNSGSPRPKNAAIETKKFPSKLAALRSKFENADSKPVAPATSVPSNRSVASRPTNRTPTKATNRSSTKS